MIKEKLRRAGAKARAFNDRPPVWAYWVFGIAVYLMIRVLRFM